MIKSPNYPVDQILPHAGDMILIDRVLECGDDSISCEVTISEKSQFQNADHEVPIWVGIEYMAQTIAAFAGTKAKDVGQDISIGFLLGTRSYSCEVNSFKQNQTLKVSAKLIWQDDEMGVFDCQIIDTQTKEELSQAHLNVFQPKDAKDFLKERSQ